MIILEDIGFKVDVYENPSKALSNFSPGHYGYCNTNIEWFYVYNRIKEIGTKIKVCFLTASETTQQEFEKGIRPIVVKEEVLIRKPIRNEDLLEKVKEF
jgi:hypothetical protein